MRVAPFEMVEHVWEHSCLDPALEMRIRAHMLHWLLSEDGMNFPLRPDAEFDLDQAVGDPLAGALWNLDRPDDFLMGDSVREVLEAICDQANFEDVYGGEGADELLALMPRRELLARLVHGIWEHFIRLPYDTFNDHLIDARVTGMGGVYNLVKQYLRLFGLKLWEADTASLRRGLETFKRHDVWLPLTKRLVAVSLDTIPFLARGRVELGTRTLRAWVVQALAEQGFADPAADDARALPWAQLPLAATLENSVERAIPVLGATVGEMLDHWDGVGGPMAANARYLRSFEKQVRDLLTEADVARELLQHRHDFANLVLEPPAVVNNVMLAALVADFVSWWRDGSYRERLQVLFGDRDFEGVLWDIRNSLMHTVEHCEGATHLAGDHANFAALSAICDQILEMLHARPMRAYLLRGGDAPAIDEAQANAWLAGLGLIQEAWRGYRVQPVAGNVRAFSSLLHIKRLASDADRALVAEVPVGRKVRAWDAYFQTLGQALKGLSAWTRGQSVDVAHFSERLARLRYVIYAYRGFRTHTTAHSRNLLRWLRGGVAGHVQGMALDCEALHAHRAEHFQVPEGGADPIVPYEHGEIDYEAVLGAAHDARGRREGDLVSPDCLVQ